MPEIMEADVREAILFEKTLGMGNVIIHFRFKIQRYVYLIA